MTLGVDWPVASPSMKISAPDGVLVTPHLSPVGGKVDRERLMYFFARDIYGLLPGLISRVGYRHGLRPGRQRQRSTDVCSDSIDIYVGIFGCNGKCHKAGQRGELEFHQLIATLVNIEVHLQRFVQFTDSFYFIAALPQEINAAQRDGKTAADTDALSGGREPDLYTL